LNNIKTSNWHFTHQSRDTFSSNWQR